jgi:hypothetical protein
VNIVTDQRLAMPADAETVWAAMSNVDAYTTWWPWLVEFDGAPIAVGSIWNCAVQPPLRYRVAFSIKFDVVVPSTHIEASVRGDIVGGAWIDLEPTGNGCDIWIRSGLAPRSQLLRVLSAAMQPVAKWGHDWIISTGAAQFQERALSG